MTGHAQHSRRLSSFTLASPPKLSPVHRHSLVRKDAVASKMLNDTSVVAKAASAVKQRLHAAMQLDGELSHVTWVADGLSPPTHAVTEDGPRHTPCSVHLSPLCCHSWCDLGSCCLRLPLAMQYLQTTRRCSSRLCRLMRHNWFK